MSNPFKTYLGDSVYAEFDGFMICLTTENGIEVTNTIFLEPQTLVALNNFHKRVLEELAQRNLKPISSPEATDAAADSTATEME